MKVPLLRDVPPRAAAVVVALALVASLVTGSPWTAVTPNAEPPARAVEVRTESQAEPLDLQSLERRKSSGTVPDLFVNPVISERPAASPSVVATAPSSPPPPPKTSSLPFRYLGRLEDGERRVIFLENGPNLYSVGVGDTLDGIYKIEAIAETSVSIRHLALDVVQTLAIPRAP